MVHIYSSVIVCMPLLQVVSVGLNSAARTDNVLKSTRSQLKLGGKDVM